ncbi:MAG: NADH-quinone oxidoreductase subunit J [Gammaproteobacteria bacterium]|nr:NADH-quinone oxidoreductase subunit J [Gammaproteobacteria bacterium]
MSEFLTPLHIIFYCFATLACGAGVVVISAKNPVHSVLSLVVAFFAMAGIWMMLHAEFLALILILVYVGAVMTLFLFVVMMLNIDFESKRVGLMRYLPVAAMLAVVMTGLIILAIGPNYFGTNQMPLPAAYPANYSNIKALGEVLYTIYAYPFEIAGVLLLTAIIAAITLTYRGPRRRRVQQVSEQLLARPENRLRIIKMPGENTEKKIPPLPEG